MIGRWTPGLAALALVIAAIPAQAQQFKPTRTIEFVAHSGPGSGNDVFARQFTTIIDFVIVMPLGPQLMQLLQLTTAQFGAIVASYTFAAGVAGLIVPDCPVDESGPLGKAASAAGVDVIALVAPTSGPERIRRIAHLLRSAGVFVVYRLVVATVIILLIVTGVRAATF